MDEVLELCRRVLGSSPLADQAAAEAHAGNHRTRVPRLAAAIKVCRVLAEQPPAPVADGVDGGTALSSAVARELASANACLSERKRELLALRELLRLSYKDVARAMNTSQDAIPLWLAHARLELYAERRGTQPDVSCPDSERALRLLACRQDGEPLSDADLEWLFAHATQCDGCGTAHAAMLEASACYRAWRPTANETAKRR
jgi:hypothetical protein